MVSQHINALRTSFFIGSHQLLGTSMVIKCHEDRDTLVYIVNFVVWMRLESSSQRKSYSGIFLIKGEVEMYKAC